MRRYRFNRQRFNPIHATEARIRRFAEVERRRLTALPAAIAQCPECQRLVSSECERHQIVRRALPALPFGY
jgi:hypothetical protein